MDVSGCTERFLEKVSDLPEEFRDIILYCSGPEYLEAIASVALDPRWTDHVLINLNRLLVDSVCRWTAGPAHPSVIPALGRILYSSPCLAEVAETHLLKFQPGGLIPNRDVDLEAGTLCELLLGAFRLLAFDCRAFGTLISLENLQSLLAHEFRPVRYLAIRCLCIILCAADAAMERMFETFLGRDSVLGHWEGKQIDYRFFSLWEEKRIKNVHDELQTLEAENSASHCLSITRLIADEDWSPSMVNIHGFLLPRTPGQSSSPSDSVNRLVPVPSTISDLRGFASALLQRNPVLLSGLAGSGKSLLVDHMSHQLNKADKLITLHLNEQSDAKLLLGMYTTGTTPGSFKWQPGVLTTAVKEGRWVFIEDLDRAPNEVIGTILPLIERNELRIPSRGQTIRAARGFRLIASVTTARDSMGQEMDISASMLGKRFWTRVTVHGPSFEELQDVLRGLYPSLNDHISTFIAIYKRLHVAYNGRSFALQVKAGSMRPLTLRDLHRWCVRSVSQIGASDSFTSATVDNMFLEAMDCFAGALPIGDARAEIARILSEELHIDPQRRDHLLNDRLVAVALLGANQGGKVRFGRYTLSRKSVRESAKQRSSRRPFANNPHSMKLLEQVSAAVHCTEPLLLVGETGTGKTTVVQHLADQLGRKLVAFNLSQQSESGDLLGGFKPVNVRTLIVPLKEEFDDLFTSTFGEKKNRQYLELLGKSYAKGQWKRVCKLWQTALDMVADLQRKSGSPRSSEHPKKRQKTTSTRENVPHASKWTKFASDVQQLEAQLASRPGAVAFSFVEGNIVKAVRNGDWILLDEINLASSDTLEAVAELFGTGSDSPRSILLKDSGNIERIQAHPDFRVFAAMNPATDVGKKDLPSGIRSKFTEIYVSSPDSDVKSLESIIAAYVGESSDRGLIFDVTNLYQEIQRLSNSNALVDGEGQRPHFSLRTLTRALTFAKDVASLCTQRRALLEGFHMSFSTLLDRQSDSVLTPVIWNHLYGKHANAGSELKRSLRRPQDGRDYVQIGQHWLRKGLLPSEEQPQYIITPFVKRNMDNLMRAASTRRFPVLIQGPTSSGKTSMVEYLAKCSGNKFVRVNNHEHTDLQEYLGTYVSGADGQLQFQEGVLVKALREGHWVVLDELNLAPTDVLEALNRLLDDNRELLIPETQEVVRPHQDFMLFATQNPAGLYGGRKALSRAFRNRFLELHFDDIPVDELQEILQRRTLIPESWSRRIVEVYKELSSLRQETRMFEQKSFATLRDLFRWASRKAESVEELALNGFMLLAERVRKSEEREGVKNIIEKVMSSRGPKVCIDETKLYSVSSSSEMQNFQQTDRSGVVWTKAMRRLFVLVAHALQNNEPVLLVGETGCGKTTVCQMLAGALGKSLAILNAHQNTETGDLIGSQRPIRNRGLIEQSLRDLLSAALRSSVATVELDVHSLLAMYDGLSKQDLDLLPQEQKHDIQILRTKHSALFEWADGALATAMRNGEHFLLDEISLADDSVLERLNSVLESQRTLLLAEKGPHDSFITAAEGFQFYATMNPGGDFGKRELSPALRNRFTEIWVPALSDSDDMLQIVEAKLDTAAKSFAPRIVTFSSWFNEQYKTTATSAISIRDALAWVDFVNLNLEPDPAIAVVHGAAMVFIDTLGANPAAILTISPSSIDVERKRCLHELSKILGEDVAAIYFQDPELHISDSIVTVGPFSVSRNGNGMDPAFSFTAMTTRNNAMRVIRAMRLPKPVLLEGNSGVGKTTLVSAIAKVVGKRLERINLSEQTDLMDLFGSDAPAEREAVGSFRWRDGPFLTAMKRGDWVLLDEMNLASQSVLEGLNACLDHRGEVYIAELDQTFHRHPDFRLFAAQNPHHQGGGRKGLPASFVNRFTVIYADIFRSDDLHLICKHAFPQAGDRLIESIVSFVSRLDHEVTYNRRFAARGSPWEFNLRDLMRWLQLATSSDGLLPSATAYDFTDILFAQRFRDPNDRAQLLSLFEKAFQQSPSARHMYHSLNASSFQVGLGLIKRSITQTAEPAIPTLQMPAQHLPTLEALMICVQQNWPVILVGSSGKTSLLEHLASTVGARLTAFAMHADIDATDLIGGYEQVDSIRYGREFLDRCCAFFNTIAMAKIARGEAVTEGISHAMAALASMDRYPDTAVLRQLKNLLSDPSLTDQSVSLLIQQCDSLLARSDDAVGARFEWVDGILVHALEKGHWLVLDNANLCSPSVLDRLNSLLEPSGFLTINEHSDANGDARVVRPHPTFRIFLTMNPRYGELSRAMRNRAVELFVSSSDADTVSRSSIAYSAESAMNRYRDFMSLGSGSPHASAIAVDHLYFADAELANSFLDQVIVGLLPDTSVSSVQTSFKHLFSLDPSMVTALKAFYVNVSDDVRFETTLSQAQSIHPLNNHALALRNGPSLDRARWLASAFEAMVSLSSMQEAFAPLRERGSRGSNMTVLERSLMSAQGLTTAAPANKSFAMFLMGSVHALRMFVIGNLESVDYERSNEWDLFRNFCTYWRSFFELLDSIHPDSALVGAFLSVGNYLITGSVHQSSRSISSLLSREFQQMRSETTTTRTGSIMERMWSLLKPATPGTNQEVDQIIALENLANRFDSVALQSSMSLHDLASTRLAFARSMTYAAHASDTRRLAQSLRASIEDIERSVGGELKQSPPYFSQVFDVLVQSTLLGGETISQNQISLWELLALRPTRNAQISNVSAASGMPKFTYSPWDKSGFSIVNGEAHRALFRKVQVASMHNVQLRDFKMLQAEAEILGQAIAASPTLICGDTMASLDIALKQSLDVILSLHSSRVDAEEVLAEKTMHTTVAPTTQYLQSTYNTRAEQLRAASSAWTELGVAFITAYVPDRPFDPSLRPQVLRGLFRRRQMDLQTTLQALQEFERLFSGRTFNLRTEVIESELAAMGAEPEAPAIARPQVSEMDELTECFRILLRLVEPLLQNPELSSQEVAQLRHGLNQICQRVSENFRSYFDITGPLIAFLRILDTGLDLRAQVDRQQATEGSQTGRHLNRLCRSSPIYGAERPSQSDPNHQWREMLSSSLLATHTLLAMRLQALNHLALQNTLSRSTMPRSLLDTVNEHLQQSFDVWKTKLGKDQDEQAANSSLYTFKGSREDEEFDDQAEFDDLFPEFVNDEPSVPTTSSAFDQQNLTRALCVAHRSIFGPPSDPQELIAKVTRDVVHETFSCDEMLSPSYLLSSTAAFPSTLLALQEGIDTLSASEMTTTYNFYKDSNTREASRLVALVQKVEVRFRQLHYRWPEHATPVEVLRISDESMRFAISEPVAKLITKVEKLHGAIHEWQKVASKEHGAEQLYHEVTQLIISWRQLELTTWATLFDLEVERCRTDAQNWWFVVYENLIAIPTALAEAGESLANHAKGLVETLVNFLHATGMGQFQSRLELIRQFEGHLILQAKYQQEYEPIRAALAHFSAYYSRFVELVQKSLTQTRHSLEKDIKEVIKLASWKDTTIEALRQSAKNSHLKLFKIVQKFRKALNQPVASLLQQLPAPQKRLVNGIAKDMAKAQGNADEDAIRICSSATTLWEERPLRFKNISMTLSLMQRLSPHSAAICPSFVEGFLSNLRSSITQLQKATPSTSSEDNEDQVKHLKSRKRKLFADTLKAVRQMGFKGNLSSDVLATQNSFATVLAALVSPAPTIGGHWHDQMEEATHYFQKVLHLMPQARHLAQEHSADLTLAEVNRSLGYLESMFQHTIHQTNNILTGFVLHASLEATISRLENIWGPDVGEMLAVQDFPDVSSFLSQTSWVSAMTKFAIKVITTQSQLGQLDIQEPVRRLTAALDHMQQLHETGIKLPALPEGLYTESHIKFCADTEGSLHELKKIATDIGKQHEQLWPVLQNLMPWLEMLPGHAPSFQQPNIRGDINVKTFQSALFKTADLVLGACQDLAAAAEKRPMSDEDRHWFIFEEQAIENELASFHTDHITTSIVNVSSMLAGFRGQDLRLCSAMVATLMPLFQQHLSTLEETISMSIEFNLGTCKLASQLAETFIIVGKDGFCTPPEKSAGKDEANEQLEAGTGLGDGEGAEDISKDIKDDEDLSDLAQQQDDRQDKQEIEDEKDAVDMADGDMEGELGDVSDKGSENDESDGSGDEDGADPEDEVGDMDDLGPSTVDEKMWNDGETAEKDKEGQKGQGKKDEDQAAAQEDAEHEQGSGDEREDMEAGEDEEEQIAGAEMEKVDPRMQEEDTLELPDDIDIDQKGDDSDGDLGSIDDKEEVDEKDDLGEEDGIAPEENEGSAKDDMSTSNGGQVEEDEEAEGQDTREGAKDDGSEPEDTDAEFDDERMLTTHDDDAHGAREAEQDHEHGIGAHGREDDDDTSANAAGQAQGTKSEAPAEEQAGADQDGTEQTNHRDTIGSAEDGITAERQAFKQLGETLERWYKQNREIRDADKERADQDQDGQQDVEMADVDFEHLPDENAAADAQALGAATHEQAHALDDDMAMDMPEPEDGTRDAQRDGKDGVEDDQEPPAESVPRSDAQSEERKNVPAQSYIGAPPKARPDEDDMDLVGARSESDVDEVHTQLSTINLDTLESPAYPRSAEEARALWAGHEASTRTLSLSLTEHLRLILAPTLATKMRGDFRTGKRLNIKRIIPYIASQYKRDKIWMRRSVPSKRTYQINLALDDSKSMAESGSAHLAFETLALVARALTMLDAGEVSVVRFGEHVEVAHEFGKAFSSEAGVEVVRRFGFDQSKTDVRRLVGRSLELFREARLRASGSAADLWQLQLVISDGICEDHATVQRLVRQAQEERIIIVFVIVDAGANASGDGKGRQRQQSIMDLQTAEFGADGNGEMKLVRRKYLDTFPFRWWIVVRDVKELPGVLATALRQWFAEVAGTGS